MDKGKITFKIITPERTVFEGEVYEITLPVEEGEVTVLPEHIPYIASVKPGEIVLKKDESSDETSHIAVSGGFLEFKGNILTLLADTAERSEEIDIARAEEAMKHAEELKRRTDIYDVDYARTAAMLEKELSRIRVARKHRSRHP